MAEELGTLRDGALGRLRPRRLAESELRVEVYPLDPMLDGPPWDPAALPIGGFNVSAA